MQSIVFLIFLFIFAGYTIITTAGNRYKTLLMKIDVKQLFLIGIVLCVNQLSMAQVRLPQLVSDGMVLQRDTKLNIWGWASPGEKINIKFHQKNYKTTTLPNGKWSVLIAAMKSGGPYTMDISASNHIIIHDILVGDVWFCSGQSNMVLPIERVKEKYPQEIARSQLSPDQELFYSYNLQCKCRLLRSSPKANGSLATPILCFNLAPRVIFSRKRLFDKYHVPIGIINSSVGGTPIQAWISANGFNDLPAYHNRVIQLQGTAYLHQLQQQPKVNYAEVEQADKPARQRTKWRQTLV
jgi:sialate O-acetylesterase